MCESHSVMSDSLQTHGLYSSRNSPGQNIDLGIKPMALQPPALAGRSFTTEPTLLVKKSMVVLG